MLLVFTRITNLLLEFFTQKSHKYKCPVNTELVTSIGCHEFTCAHKHARVGSRVKGLNTRVLIENKPFARELVHASIKLEMSCTVAKFTKFILYSKFYAHVYSLYTPYRLLIFVILKYWEIFRGFTVDQIREREKSFEYPPRLQIRCEQIDDTKPLYSSFEESKRSKNREMPIAKFSLIKKVSGESDNLDVSIIS